LAQWLTFSISRLEHAASGPAALGTACSLGAGRAPAHAVKGTRCPWEHADRMVQTIGWLSPSLMDAWQPSNQALSLVPNFAQQCKGEDHQGLWSASARPVCRLSRIARCVLLSW